MNNVYCFLCNHCLVYGENYWSLFDNDFKETTEVAQALAAILSKILKFKLELNEQKNLHLLTVICDACNANVLEYQKLKKKCLVLQAHIEWIYYTNRKTDLENEKSTIFDNQVKEVILNDNHDLICIKSEDNADNESIKSIIEKTSFDGNLEEDNKEVKWYVEDDTDSIIVPASESTISNDVEENSLHLNIDSQMKMHSKITANSMESNTDYRNQSEMEITVISPNVKTEECNYLQFVTDDIIINEDNESHTEQSNEIEKTYDLPSNTNTSFSENIDKHNQEQDFLNINLFNLLADNNGDNAVDGLQFDSDRQDNDKNHCLQFNGMQMPKPVWNQKKTDDIKENIASGKKCYVCNLCQNTPNDQLQDQKALKNHFQTIHNCIYYTCLLCDLGFSNYFDKMLHDHLIHKSSINGFNESNQFNLSNSKDSNSTKSHININDSASNKININTNTTNNSNLNNFDKNLANDEDNDIDTLLQFFCDICQNTFNSPLLLRLHKRTHLDVSDKPYECVICYKRYSSKVNLNEHLNSHTGNRPYNCTECGKNFATRCKLQTHLKTHLNNKRLFNCDVCKKSFSNRQNLNQHCKLHEKSINDTKLKNFKNDLQVEPNRGNHSTNHTIQKTFVCSTCGKAFARKPELEDHERTHTGERPFKCDLCPLAFAQRSNLNSHKKIKHYNEKTHKCEECGRSFKRKRILQYHRLSAHTTERPHKCDICGSTFIYPEHYKKHMFIHSGHKPYACEICGKRFNSRDNRNSHRFVHSEKKLYECMECGAGFMRKPQLLAHMKQTNHISDTIIVNHPQLDTTLDSTEKQTLESNDDITKKSTTTPMNKEMTTFQNGNIVTTAKLKTESLVTKITDSIASLETVQKNKIAPTKIKPTPLSLPVDTITCTPVMTTASLTTTTTTLPISTSLSTHTIPTLMTTTFLDSSIDSLVPSLASIDTMPFVQYDDRMRCSDENRHEVVLVEIDVDQLQVPSDQLLVNALMNDDLLSTVDQQLDSVNYFNLNEDPNLLI